MNTENLRADFKDWLSHPITEIFIKIISKQREDHLTFASGNAFSSYYKKELSEQAILGYGKADGITTVISLMETSKDSDEAIASLFEDTFGGKKDD